MLAEKIVDDVLQHLYEGPPGIADELDLLMNHSEKEYADLKAQLRTRVQGLLDQEAPTAPGGGASSDAQPEQPQNAPSNVEEGELPAG